MKKTIALAFALLALRTLAATSTVFVDATDARRGVFHAHLTIPAAPGAMTLVYPKWIPGEHMPTGPVMQMAGLHIHAGQSELAWSRDKVDMFAFHIDVPRGVQTIDVDFDYLSPSQTFGGGYGESANATQNLLLILFNHVVVYPAGTPTDQLTYHASVRLPASWKFDTALPVAKQDGDRIDFAPVSLTTLIDSPLMAGAFTRTIPVADGGREHITLIADSAPALAMPEANVAQARNLVAECDALFGARHYREYRWLVSLSDLLEPQGLEHHESTDIRGVERAISDATIAPGIMGTISHEFVHSWNGKYRRPAGLATPDYQAPQIGELLYVYEGMTRYYGNFVLTARSGIFTEEQDREYAAYVAANQDRNRPGRTWRPLADTAVFVPILGDAPSEEVPYRRTLDYYDESLLVWLDADMIIRAKTNGARSLDDFAKSFFGAPSSAPMVKPYTLDDVIAALNQVAANDWRAFFDTRVYRIAPHPPLGALEAAGWRLVYTDTPNWWIGFREHTHKPIDESFSIGIWVKNEGTIADVVHGSAAYAAGLMPGMKITSINGRKFSDDVLHEETRAAKPLTIAAEQATFSGSFTIENHAGERFPHLERISGTPDLLTDIMKSRRK
jgi:predicted metalloprotease with PDZ domain